MGVIELAYEAAGWSVGRLWLDDGDRVLHHELPRPGLAGSEGDGAHPVADGLRAYFAGEEVSFEDVDLDLDGATPFQRAVADALRRVPYGESVTYGELAALAGHPNAYRAAGTVCARNRFPVLVPCHRVVGASGIGPFGSLGTSYKERLLALEHRE